MLGWRQRFFALVFIFLGGLGIAAPSALAGPEAAKPVSAGFEESINDAVKPATDALISAGFDESINDAVKPATDALESFVLYEAHLFGADIPLVVVWLVAGALFFTLYFRFVNLRGLRHSVNLLRGCYTDPSHPGEVSHFQARTAALSGTIGVGNIGGVAVAISLGGPGVTLWMILAGFLGMSTKFVECILAVTYRKQNDDGSMSGGPMYYLDRGLRDRGYPRLGRVLGVFYAVGIVVGCLGIGNMFQSNQAFAQIVAVTGGAEDSFFADKGWLIGGLLAVAIAFVIIGGIQKIAMVTAKVVPFMALVYIGLAVAVLALNISSVPAACATVVSEAFSPKAIGGGVVGAMIVGFQRAVFSNEAGIGSAAIAHSAVRTKEPSTEGFVAMLGPLIDTVVICALTALVIVTTTEAAPGYLADSGTEGVATTTAAIERAIPYAGYIVGLVAVLFAFSTAISWSYYGLKGWTYLVGERPAHGFKVIFCVFVAIGAMIKLDAVLDFSDALVFLICIPNICGLYILAPVAKRELNSYWDRLTRGQLPRYKQVSFQRGEEVGHAVATHMMTTA